MTDKNVWEILANLVDDGEILEFRISPSNTGKFEKLRCFITMPDNTIISTDFWFDETLIEFIEMEVTNDT